MRTQGQELRDGRANSVDLAYCAAGNLTHFLVGKGSPMAARIAGFNGFVAPASKVAVGETYRFERAAGADGLPASELGFKLVRVDGEAATLEVSFRETSGADRASGAGTWNVDVRTGQPVSLELNLRGFKTGLGDLVRYRLTRL